MRLKICGFLLVALPIFALASEVDFAKSDFIERSINFVIFAAILWYLVAGRLKAALKARQEGISSQLSFMQDRLAQSKIKKDEALKSLESSKQKAYEIIESAKKEAAIIAQNTKNQCENDIKTLNKNYQERKDFEKRRMKRAVIDDILDELLLKNDINLGKSDYIDILLKRVA